MPNWVTNRITIRGSRDAVYEIVKKGLANSGLATTGDIEKDAECLISNGKHKGEINEGEIVLQKGVTAETFFPMPDTFIKYDTANHPDGDRLRVGEKLYPWTEESPVVTEELIEEYRKATAEQKVDYGVVGWYDYRCRFLGCKWDFELDNLDICEVSENVWEMSFDCQTPWSFPHPWLDRILALGEGMTAIAMSEEESNEWNAVFMKKSGTSGYLMVYDMNEELDKMHGEMKSLLAAKRDALLKNGKTEEEVKEEVAEHWWDDEEICDIADGRENELHSKMEDEYVKALSKM